MRIWINNTDSLHVTMDKNKASAFLNMKKPSSLYELHSRLASFQYQQAFLPFIKHILYPLNFLLRKKQFTWTDIEERAWQTAIALTNMNIQLVVPDAHDTLVLTTDASTEDSGDSYHVQHASPRSSRSLCGI